MTGVHIVGAMLREYAPLLAIVPEARIKAGVLPENITLPALLVRLVSSVDRQPLKRGQSVRKTARVSVTVRAASYRDQGIIIGLINDCCAARTGDIGGGKAVSILTAGLGPDVAGPAASFEQTQDFRVSFEATT